MLLPPPIRRKLPRISWPSWMCRFRRRIGRRGFFLFVLAYIDLIYGMELWWPDDPNEDRRVYLAEAVPFLNDVDASMRVWAVAWWVTGLLCLVNVFRRNDWVGYAAAAMIKVAWVTTLIISAMQGLTNGWRSASVWFIVMVAVLVIGSWAEEPYVLADLAAAEEKQEAVSADDDQEAES